MFLGIKYPYTRGHHSVCYDEHCDDAPPFAHLHELWPLICQAYYGLKFDHTVPLSFLILYDLPQIYTEVEQEGNAHYLLWAIFLENILARILTTLVNDPRYCSAA